MKKTLLKNKKSLLIALLLITSLSYTAYLFARNTGVANRTAKNQGCDCHGVTPSSQTALSAISQSGSFTVAPGSKTKFTITLSHPSLTKAGIDIAVKTSESGATNAGTLEAVSAGLKLSNGEIVHSAPASLNNGKVEFTVSWTAPTVPGTYFLRAAGNAANGDGEEGGDQWNWMTPITITVDNLQNVTDNFNESSIFAYPNPLSQNVTINFSSSLGENYTLRIIDLNGRLLRSITGYGSSNSTNSLVWDGKNDAGQPLSKGIYFAVITIGGKENIIQLVKNQ